MFVHIQRLYKFRLAFNCLLSVLLIFGYQISAQAHDDNNWPYGLVVCDEEAGLLKISEEIAESKDQIPTSTNIAAFDQMLRYVPISENDGVLEVVSKYRKTCRLNKSNYLVEIIPYIYNKRVQGMCGAAAPSLQLTISKNRKVLIRDLTFRVNCLVSEEFGQRIKSVSLFEARKKIDFQLINNIDIKHKSYSYKDAALLKREKLFK